jgi:hypothetical protein
VDNALLRLAAQARDAQQLLADLAATLGERCVDPTSSRTKVNCETLAGQPAIIMREVFKFAWRQAGWPEQSIGFDEWQQLAILATGAGRQSLNLPGGIRAKRDGSFVVLEVLAG